MHQTKLCDSHPSKHMLRQRWASVVDGGPTLIQHWVNMSRVYWDNWKYVLVFNLDLTRIAILLIKTFHNVNVIKTL